MRATRIHTKKNHGNAFCDKTQIADLDLVDSLLKTGYGLAYIDAKFDALRSFFHNLDAPVLLGGQAYSLSPKRLILLIDAFAKSGVLLTSRGMQSVFKVAATTVVKWERVLVRNGFLFARWSKGTWKVYQWADGMRGDIDPEYNLLHVIDPPCWFQPDDRRVEVWRKQIRECDEEIRLRNKYGIPLSNDGEYRFVLARREESERQQNLE